MGIRPLINSSSQWILQFVLPNLVLQEPIECEFIALAPNQDPRLDSLRTGVSGQLLSCFENPFGKKLEPAALLTRKLSGNQKPSLEAILAFRHAVAMAVLVTQWSAAYQQPGNIGVLYSDSFDLYPFTPTDTNTHFNISSPAVLGLTLSGSFRGQCSAALPSPFHHPLKVNDHTLLEPLLHQWRRRFIQERKEWKTTALFRSLAVAFQAARIPSDTSPSLYDVGTRAVLWVSAFEILVHPGKSGRADLEKVLDLLSLASWEDKHLKDRKFRITLGRKKRAVRLCEKLYKQLYDARNDFAHGNPVNIRSIFPFRTPNLSSLHSIAPLLYRAALCAYLKLGKASSSSKPAKSTISKKHIDYAISQSSYENGLLSALHARPGEDSAKIWRA